MTERYFKMIVSKLNTPKKPSERKPIVDNHPSTGLLALKLELKI